MRLIVPFPPGGQIDIIARLIGQWLSGRVGQQFVVENRAGAGGNIGTEAVVRAAADGNTLLLASVRMRSTRHCSTSSTSISFATPRRSLASTAFRSCWKSTLVSGQDRAEFINYAKSNPGKIGMASAAKGTGPYMASELFKMMTGVE